MGKITMPYLDAMTFGLKGFFGSMLVFAMHGI